MSDDVLRTHDWPTDAAFADTVRAGSAALDDAALAELIDEDGELGVALGRSVTLDRYLRAVPDLDRRSNPLDAAIGVALSSLEREGLDRRAAAERLIAEHPALESAIRTAVELDEISSIVVTGEGSSEPDGAPSMQIRGYRIRRELATGGQGIVFVAHQVGTDRDVALKVIAPGIFASEAERARFHAGVRIAANLRHPNIVTVHDGGESQGRLYYAMELVDGENLESAMKSRRPTIDEALRCFVGICGAVEEAHGQLVVHRDLSPSNVLVDEHWRPWLLDFGLARPIGAGPEDESDELTVIAASPERIAGDRQIDDVAADVWSLGALLHRLLVDAHPYGPTEDAPALMDRIVHASPQRPSDIDPAVPSELDAIVLRALARRPADRYDSAAAMREDVERFLAGEAVDAVTSRIYHAGKWLARRARRHPAVVRSTLVVLAATLVHVVGGGLLHQRWVFNDRWEQLALLAAAPHGWAEPFDHVRVIAFERDAAMVALGERLDLPVDPERLTSYRALHGALLEHLRAAEPAVVAFDVMFEAEDARADPRFRAGVEAMVASGTDVLVSVGEWSVAEGGRPPVSPAILAGDVQWGGVTGRFRPDAPWRLHLVMQRGRNSAVPSLALKAVAATEDDDVDLELEIDDRDEVVELRFEKQTDEHVPRARSIVAPPKVFPLSQLVTRSTDVPALGLEAGDDVGDMVVLLPDDEVLEAITIAYEDVFDATEDELRAWFSGRVVIVADQRPGRDRHPYIDGRTSVPGCYAHAAGIETLLDLEVEDRTIIYPRSGGWLTVLIGSALLGSVGSTWLRRRRWRWLVAGVGGVLVSTVLAFGILRWAGVLFDPVLPAGALLLSAWWETSRPKQASGR